MSLKRCVHSMMNALPDELYIKLKYYHHFHKFPNLKNPLTFNEKIQWLKLHDRRPEYIQMVDKYLVKDYVANIIGKEYIIPTIGVWDNVNEIEWESLPNQFVLKWNHDSGSIVICKDKNNFIKEDAIKRLNSREHHSGYLYGREWPYKNVKPKIIAEKFVVDESGTELKDYKFFCFNGVVKMFKIDFGRFSDHHANYYDNTGAILPFGEKYIPPIFDKELVVPTNLSEMISIANKLSFGIPFVRIDLYNNNGKIYFGEITLYPASGYGVLTSDEYDILIGEWLHLENENK